MYFWLCQKIYRANPLLCYSPTVLWVVGAQGTAPGLTTSAIDSIVGESILGDCRLGDRLRVDCWFGDLLWFLKNLSRQTRNYYIMQCSILPSLSCILFSFRIQDDANPFHSTVFYLEMHVCRRLHLGDGGVNLRTKQHIHCTRGGTLAFVLFYQC
jgi:hypothetical protein